ncbi:MAG: hypothetical protein WA461_00350 [Nitrososphaeraceae archaeon]
MRTLDYIIGRTVCEYPQIEPSAYKINNRQQNLRAADLASNMKILVSAPWCTASPEVMKIRCVVTRSVQLEDLRNLQEGQQSVLNQNFKKHTNGLETIARLFLKHNNR